MESFELIDTHCHIDFEAFDHDRETVIQNARRTGVKQLVIPGVSAITWERVIELSTMKGIFIALGLHPCFIDQHSEQHLEQLEAFIHTCSPVAIGEIGLDFFIQNPQTALQKHYFESQLKIAEDAQLPVIIHARKSIDTVIQTIEQQKFSHGGIMHAFNGSLQQAEKLIAMGFKLGFGGMLTYERSNKLRQLAKSLPLASIVLETDSPDMTGANHHGERNSPEYLPEVLDTLSQIRAIPQSELANITSKNAQSVLNLSIQD